MAENHSDSFAICKNDKKFKACDKNNMNKSNTCPTCNGAIEDDKITSNSNANEVFFTNEYFSNIVSDDSDSRDSLNTNDMQFSSSGSMLNTSFNSDFMEDTALEDEFLSSPSENEFNPKSKYIDESIPEIDTISLSSINSSVTNINKGDSLTCAVVLCNENARKQFDVLFFINFPNDIALRNTWWEICGRKEKFDPSLKICSIHFNLNDFKTIIVRRDEKLYRQTILQNNKIVPTLYLSPHEYTKFIRKRTKNITNNIISDIAKESSENKKCIIQSCNKTFLKDSKTTLFFKFPLENQVLLKKWVDKIELPNWQPLEADRICSDHFESYYINKYNDAYDLDQYAVPSIKPQNPFKIKFEENKKICYNDDHFKNLEFINLDDYVILVEEKNKSNNEKEKSNSLHSLENSTEEKNKRIKLHNKTPETVTTLSNSDERVNVLSSSNKCNNSSLEYMNVLDDLNNIEELQLKLDGSTSLTKQYLESFEKEIAEEIENNVNSSNNNDLGHIYLNLFNNENTAKSLPITNTSLANQCVETKLELNTEKKSLDKVKSDSNDTILSDQLYNECTPDLVQGSLVKSYDTDNNIFGETSMISEFKMNENANNHSYVNLNMLNDVDIGTFLSLKKEWASKIKKDICTSQHNMTKKEVKTKEHDVKNISYINTVNNISPTISSSNLTKEWHIESINIIDSEVTPESIIFNQDLTECYGEMLPPYCNPDCQLLCFYSIPGPQRREVYNEFNMLQNLTEQNCKIAELAELHSITKREVFPNSVSYHLMMNKKLIKVCRTFFLNTLGITKNRLDAILKPVNYSWYSDRDRAIKANVLKQAKVLTDESIIMTDFINESSILLNKDFNLFEPESDTEVSLANVSVDEYEKATLFVKSIPRVLSTCQMTLDMKKRYFETSICVENMYKIYSESYIKNKTPPPFTELQFKKIYNQCMKALLKMV